MSVRILVGDVRARLRDLPDESVQCVITSPPYWGLRDYDIDGQLGLEASPAEHVAVMVDVFREVRRVLRSDGTVWLNYGDSYASSVNGRSAAETKALGNDDRTFRDKPFSTVGGKLKPKDLVGMPWRVAFGLQDDGWWLRQDIIWSKPNPMPESILDRCTKAHEYLFLLAKSERYYFDHAAIQEPANYDPARSKMPDGWATYEGAHGAIHRNGREKGRASGNKTHKGVIEYETSSSEEHRTKAGLLAISETAYATRHKRSVWTVPAQPFKEAHFATFPPALIEPCVLAGCPAGGVVLDPFGGAGTTGLVCERLQRDAILIELNPGYAAMAERRIRRDSTLFARVSVEA